MSFQMFKDAIRAAVIYKNNPTDFMDEIMKELEVRSNIRRYVPNAVYQIL